MRFVREADFMTANRIPKSVLKSVLEAIHATKCFTFACAVFGILLGTPATACGDSEAGLPCDDAATGAESSAQWMLKRVVAAVERDEGRALAAFTAGADGFRTADTYVFCINPDGIMGAHPNPILRGHDVRDLHDRTGHYFIKTMMRDAKPGRSR